MIDTKTGKSFIKNVKKHDAPLYMTVGANSSDRKYYLMFQDENGKLHDINGEVFKDVCRP